MIEKGERSCAISSPATSEATTSPVHGVVFDDRNGNGQQDAGEAGRAGLIVTIRDLKGAVLATVVTGPDGSYVVPGITAADYTVEVTVPPGCASQTCS